MRSGSRNTKLISIVASEDFQQAFRAAHILGTDKIRVFTFLRTAEPEKLHQQIADVIGEMA